MKTPDERILKLIDFLKFQKTIKTMNQFCEEIGVLRQTIYKIRNGDAGFTVAHIDAICKKYKVNANWIFGIDTNVFKDNESITL